MHDGGGNGFGRLRKGFCRGHERLELQHFDTAEAGHDEQDDGDADDNFLHGSLNSNSNVIAKSGELFVARRLVTRHGRRSRYAGAVREPRDIVADPAALSKNLRYGTQPVRVDFHLAAVSGHKTYRTVGNERAFVKRIMNGTGDR